MIHDDEHHADDDDHDDVVGSCQAWPSAFLASSSSWEGEEKGGENQALLIHRHFLND